MALVDCAVCKASISVDAVACPHCGHPRSASAQGSAPAVDASQGGLATPSVLIALGGAAVAVGSFLPWITVTAVFVGTISRSGLDDGGDGIITLAGGLILVTLGLVNLRSLKRGAAIGALIVGGLVAIVVFVDFQDVSSRVAEFGTDLGVASVGVGIWVMFVGAASAIVGSIMGLRSEPHPLQTRKNPL